MPRNPARALGPQSTSPSSQTPSSHAYGRSSIVPSPIGISAAAHFAGVKSAMLMQNHGFLASVNGIVSCAQLYRIPLLMLISARGEFGERDPWQTEGGLVTTHLLDALRIPFDRLDAGDHVAKRIAKAQTLAYSASRPVALLLGRDLMWEDA